MIADELAALTLLPPWRAAELPALLAAELAREVTDGHPLAGQRVIAIARHDDSSRILFWLPQFQYPLAVVELTWSGRDEPAPHVPPVEFYRSLGHWVEACMKPEAR